MEVPEHNSDPSKIILTAYAKDSPFVKQWYTRTRKSFIAFIKVFNEGSLPAWIYRMEQKEELQKLRQKWTDFHSVFPTLGFESETGGTEDLMKIVSGLDEIGDHFDGRLKSCQPWKTYSINLKTLRVKVEDYVYDNM
jgi:hypothetical protein